MNCFSTFSLLSILPGFITSVFHLPQNPSSVWGGEEEDRDRPPESVASDSGNATYSMNTMMPPISKSPTTLSRLQQEEERAYIPALSSPRGNIQIIQSFYWYGRHYILRTFSTRYCQSVCHLYAR
jgi:hypothetical protein